MKSIEKFLTKSLMQILYLNGELTDEDIKDEKIIQSKLKDIFINRKFEFVLEHRDSIIESARHFKKTKEKDKAILFYAIFFEHSLNRIIEGTCSKLEIERKTITEIIKNVSIHGKTTWLLTLLNLPKLNETHKKVIQKVAEERNSYVHYKWTPSSDEPDDEIEKKDEKLFLQIEKTVTYLKSFESKIFFNKKKGYFEKNLKI